MSNAVRRQQSRAVLEDSVRHASKVTLGVDATGGEAHGRRHEGGERLQVEETYTCKGPTRVIYINIQIKKIQNLQKIQKLQNMNYTIYT